MKLRIITNHFIHLIIIDHYQHSIATQSILKYFYQTIDMGIF